MSIERFLPVIWDQISYLVTMETHLPIIFSKNRHKCENLISGFQHAKQIENTILGSENINKNVFLTISLLIIITKDFPLICQ